MKQANAYYRKHKTLDGCPGISQATREWLTRPGVFAKGDGSPLALYGCPYPAYDLQNSNANIKRIRQRIASLQAVKASPTQEEQHTTDAPIWKTPPLCACSLFSTASPVKTPARC